MVNLITCFNEAVGEEFMDAHEVVSRKTIQIRVFKKFLRQQRLSLADLKVIIDPETVFVNPSLSLYLNTVNVAAEGENEEIVRNFYSKDYHTKDEVESFCNFMDDKIAKKETGSVEDQRYASHAKRDLDYTFAIDGFRGPNRKNYISNLKYGLRETPHGFDWEEDNNAQSDVREKVHVRAVRNLYEKFYMVNLQPEIIRIAIQNAFDQRKSSDFFTNEVSNAYKKYVGSGFENIKNYIESKYVCYTESE